MPIEVKELHIRVAVNAQDSASSPGGGDAPAGAPSAGQGADVEAVVALCVEQVMQLLLDRKER